MKEERLLSRRCHILFGYSFPEPFCCLFPAPHFSCPPNPFTFPTQFKTQRYTMGNANEPQSTQLTFQQLLQDRHFGQVQIYHTNEGLFIMKLTRTAIIGERHQLQQTRIIDLITHHGVPSVIPIVHLQRSQQKGMCVSYERTEIYTEYYNFTLEDLMNAKKEVEECQLWFLFESMLRLAIALKEHGMNICLELDNVFLTPAGIPCVYHYHLRSIKESFECSELTMGQSIAKIMLQFALGMAIEARSEEQIKKQEHLVNKMTVRYKILGSVVRQMLGNSRTEEECLECIHSLAERELIQLSSEVKLLKFKYNLPENRQFLNLPTLTKNSSTISKEDKENISDHPLKTTPSSILKDSNRQPSAKSSKKLQTDHSNTKEPRSSYAKSALNDSSSKKSNITLTKDQNLKELSDLQRKKEEYRLQSQKFLQRKMQLLRSTKAPPSLPRRSQKKKEGEGREKKGQRLR